MNTGKVLSVVFVCLLPFSVLYPSDSPGVSSSGPTFGTLETRSQRSQSPLPSKPGGPQSGARPARTIVLPNIVVK